MKLNARVLFLTLIMLVAVLVAACPSTVKCPVHDNDCYFTGTKVIDGRLMGVYHCFRGHDLLARCD